MNQPEELSFAPDRKSVQGATFQFSGNVSLYSGERGYSSQDSLKFKIDKIYQTKFPDVNPTLRRVLVDILVPDVPLMHRNLDMLATANYIVHSLRIQVKIKSIDQMTPELYKWYFDQLSTIIMNNVDGKTNLQNNLSRANFKTTLLRYIYYVWKHTEK
jgi:hypothetical protein